MPSSFSRLLDEDELQKIRELYLQSLAALEDEEFEDEEDEEPEEDAGSADAVQAPIAADPGGPTILSTTDPGVEVAGEPERADR
jgi:hypothetical protein